ncbi:MAG: hypothetical protein ACRD1C_03840 [Terriglobales bacterium]
MMWGKPTRELRRERDHALVRAVQMEARLRDLSEERDRLQAQLREARAALERVVDNALFAAGAAPAFHPEDTRFRPRDVTAQQAEAVRAASAAPLSPDEWRHRVEQEDAAGAARDRKAVLVAQLRRQVEARKAEDAQEANARAAQ